MDTLAEMPEAQNAIALDPLTRSRANFRREEKRDGDSLKFLNTYIFKFLCIKPRVQFFQLVLFYFLFLKYLNIFQLLHPRREEIFQLHR